MNIMIAGILLLACVLVQHCASYPPPKLPWGPSSFSGISAEASERRLTAPPGDCFLVPYEYDNGNVIHSTLFCSRGVVSNTDGACISSLFERCDTTQFPGIVFGAGAKKRYIVQEGNTRHWIGFYDVSNPDGGLCIYYTLEECHTIKRSEITTTTKQNYAVLPPGPGR